MKVPDSAIGRDTETNLQAGILFGAVDQIDGMIGRIRAEMGWDDLSVILTGGLGGLLVGQLRTSVISDPDLTVKGLYLIQQRCGQD